MTWWAVKTKGKSEKSVAKRFSAMGFDSYCPQYLSTRKWSDRIKKIQVPLFNGYVFVKKDDKIINKLIFVKGVLGFVKYSGSIAEIKDCEIQKIKEFTGELNSHGDENLVFSLGDKVLIKNGILQDQIGELIESQNNHKRLFIEQLGLEIIVDLNDNYLEKI